MLVIKWEKNNFLREKKTFYYSYETYLKGTKNVGFPRKTPYLLPKLGHHNFGRLMTHARYAADLHSPGYKDIRLQGYTRIQGYKRSIVM